MVLNVKVRLSVFMSPDGYNCATLFATFSSKGKLVFVGGF